MSDRFTPTVIPTVEVERVFTEFQQAELGQWYMAKSGEDDHQLMCIMEIGSNYVLLHEPEMPRGGYSYKRVHRDDFGEKLTFEPNAEAKIREMVEHYQNELAKNMAEIQRLSEHLGIAPQLAHRPQGDSEGKSLALLNGQVDIEAFKNSLILAKKETLPGLFKKHESIADELGRWMSASCMPMKALLGPMKASVEKIDDRLLNIQLYAGMLETIFTLSEGQPAGRDEKLRIMQRRLYMDEECLLDYASGGMEFKNIGEFDQWLAKPVNRDRILPFPRCMVSMRVRRNFKDRSDKGLSAFVEIREAQADKFTYLIVRNGDQLYRVCTEIDFGELMFPDRSAYDPTEPMMMRLFAGRMDRMMSKREFDSRVAESEKREAESQQWALDNPKEEWEKANPNKDWHYFNPFRGERFDSARWQPFDDTSTYFDEGMKTVQTEIKEYNRIAMVVQGLFDRTATLMPHNPVRMWQAASFSSAVELIYDYGMTLHYGEAPDIEAYIKACNAQTTPDSVMYGQELVWMEREAERENRRTENNWRIPYEKKHFYKTLAPAGDPGPGVVAKMAAWKPRSKVATFTWQRDRRQYVYGKETLKVTVTAPLDRLFNVSAYQLGDFKRFFADPRTREQYLSWAPMLLTAEDFHRGHLTAQEPLAD
jgi:hypothetical protein